MAVSPSSPRAHAPPFAAARSRRLLRRAAGRLLLAAPRLAELAALWALAVAWPLFDVLGRYPEFFTVRGSSARDVVVFAVAVAALPPLLLWAATAALAGAAPRAGAAVHVVTLAALVGLLALRAAVGAPAVVSAAVAAAAAAGAGAVYVRHPAVRTALVALAPVPAVVVALFLLASPASALVRGDGSLPTGAARAAPAPVVLIVFDELSTVSLLDRRGRIDRRRFPGFASLAADATWYRDAVTVHGHTENAVPAILTGRMPQPGLHAVYADHPRNLFTLLAPTHEVRALETMTRLCPREVCRPGSGASGALRSSPAWTRTLVSDAAVVYLRGTLPGPLAGRLPDVTTTWGGFGRGDRADRAPPAPGTVCGRSVCDFAALIGPSARPRLYFLHSLLPHAPWLYLPDGKQYPWEGVKRPPGVDARGRWTTETAPPLVGYERHLLQLGYADRGLRLILGALRRNGLYDDALIVVTADHGVDFRPGEQRRLVTARTLDQIAFVPLLVKLPRQARPRVATRPARTVDIVPTIADALGVRMPWRTDGRSLLRRAPRGGGRIVVAGHDWALVAAPTGELLARRAVGLRRQVALFGDGPWSRLYRVGDGRRLVGRTVGSLRVADAGGTVAFARGTLLRDVDPSSPTVPVYVSGTVQGAPAHGGLAITVNGVVAALVRTYVDGGTVRFMAMLDPRALRPGTNELAAFRVESRGSRAAVLRRLAPAG